PRSRVGGGRRKGPVQAVAAQPAPSISAPQGAKPSSTREEGESASSLREVDRRFLAIQAALDLIGQTLVLVQRLHAGGLHSADVDEAVCAAVFRRNEAIALVGVEELYGANRHKMFLSRT